MNILVAIKQVVHYNVAIRLKADGSGVETNNVKMAMNPFDEIALEEAIRLKEKGLAAEVIVTSIGHESCQEVLRSALAMGADRAILLTTTEDMQPLATAKLLKALALNVSPQLILLGKQAIDSDNNQVGQMLAGLLNWPQGTFASALELQDKSIKVTREIDGGLETLLLTLPAVITTDLRLNEPRYITLPNIMKAKSKRLDMLPAESLTTDISPRIRLKAVSAPEQRRHCVRMETAAELVLQLKKDQVIP